MCRGYEVREINGDYIAAFSSPSDAVDWCTMLKMKLHKVTSESLDKQCSDMMSGMNMSMGIAMGSCLAMRPCPRTARAEYFGVLLNTAARVARKAKGGQIYITKEAWDVAKSEFSGVSSITSHHLGSFNVCDILYYSTFD